MIAIKVRPPWKIAERDCYDRVRKGDPEAVAYKARLGEGDGDGPRSEPRNAAGWPGLARGPGAWGRG